ncbi:MAG: hypothetical protein QY323_04460 [Patescibacteria group bacterium]|nr:MAG: hypothetical protein QY323_04460 [Patescibacteria group bacterium]
MRLALLATFVLLCSLLPRLASAEEAETNAPMVESWTDFGGTIPFREAFDIRLQGRIVISQDDLRDAYEASAGGSRELWPHATLDVTAGYGYGGERHTFILTAFHEATFGKGVHSRGYAVEQRLRRGDGWSHEGFYRVDYAIVGLHLVHAGIDELAAGFQIGTGLGYRQARVEARFSFGLAGHATERVTACVLTFNVP